MIELWSNQTYPDMGPDNEGCPSITPYLLEDRTNPTAAVIVFPGGGYARRAPHEAEPIARWLNSIGISAFVLNYRVAPYKHPVPLGDAERAVRLVRHRAAEWHVDPKRIGVLGFSAGGHLAATLATHYDQMKRAAGDPIDNHSSRPDLVILAYAVITLGEFTHAGSRDFLLGENPDPQLIRSLSNETQVTADTPPMFLWHNADDLAVPVENSLHFAEALSKHKVPFSLHVFPKGGHGVGMAFDFAEASQWTSLCETWLKERAFTR